MVSTTCSYFHLYSFFFPLIRPTRVTVKITCIVARTTQFFNQNHIFIVPVRGTTPTSVAKRSGNTASNLKTAHRSSCEWLAPLHPTLLTSKSNP